MKPSVDVETTVPSYYATTRSGPELDIARTREWWDRERDGYLCFVSAVVLDELSEGEYPSQDTALRLVGTMPLLAVNPRVVEIASAYQAARVMPGPPVRDALHVALACYYRVDFLLTWNCVHIANANKRRHLQTVNIRLGLETPQIITPHMLRPVEDT